MIFHKVANVMENAVIIIEDITSMLNSRMEAGDPAALIAYDEMTVTTSKVGILNRVSSVYWSLCSS